MLLLGVLVAFGIEYFSGHDHGKMPKDSVVVPGKADNSET